MTTMLMSEMMARAKGDHKGHPFGFFREILSALLCRPYHLAQGEVDVRCMQRSAREGFAS